MHISARRGVGLRHGSRSAAVFLAAFAATDPNVLAGATVAAQMERVHAELSSEDPETVTQNQIDWILDRMLARGLHV